MTKNIKNNFLQRHAMRGQSKELSRYLVLGTAVSVILITVSAYKLYVSVFANNELWRVLLMVGAALAVLTLVVPAIWHWPSKFLQKFGGFIGYIVMTIILTVMYFIAIWPVGVLLRAIRKDNPIYSWEQGEKLKFAGWTEKDYAPDILEFNDGPGGKRTSHKRTGFFKVIRFFIIRGNILFVPILIILVSLGIALFFLQTSALAPLIYTLF